MLFSLPERRFLNLSFDSWWEWVSKACREALLTPRGLHYGCRHFYDLVYRSSRESHIWDNMWRRLGIDPKAGRELEKRGDTRMLHRFRPSKYVKWV